MIVSFLYLFSDKADIPLYYKKSPCITHKLYTGNLGFMYNFISYT